MLIIQFDDYIDPLDFPVEIIQSFKHNTYLIDCEISEYDVISNICKQYPVISMQSNEDCAYIDVQSVYNVYNGFQDTLAPS